MGGDDHGVVPHHRGIHGGGIVKAPRSPRERRMLDGELLGAARERGDLVAARQGSRDRESTGALGGTDHEQAEGGHRSSG